MMSWNKFNARKTEVDGIVFHSEGESERYVELKMLQMAGEISELELQPEFLLLNGFKDNTGKKHRAIKYRADFKYYEADRISVEDYKG